MHVPNSLDQISSKDKGRLLGIAFFLALLFAFLFIQFFRLQVIEHEKWVKAALIQHTVTVKEPFKRGLFYSNTDIKPAHPCPLQPFVIDVAKFHVYIDPLRIPEKYRDEISRQIASFLHLSKAELASLRAEFDKPSHSRKVAMWVTSDLKDQLYLWWLKAAKEKRISRNALYFIKDYQRCYPFGKLLGQVLHTVRELRDEVTQQNIPTGGLEFVFDEILQGKMGSRRFFRSPRHEMDLGAVIEAPEDGADVYLTINHYLQAIAEEELEAQVKKAEAKRGWAVMMDPNTGEVLLLAQYPFFHPMEYKKYFNDKNALKEIEVKAITDPYEPGSTMKAITLAVALLANQKLVAEGKKPLFDPEEKMATSPSLFPGRTKPIKDIHTHRFLNMNMAMQKSSNVYVAKLVKKIIDELGVSWYRGVLEEVFGFGKKTGIELPAESAGLLPSPNKLHPNGTLEWSLPTPYSLAMGHNILVNSFQMVRAFAIIANGGYEVRPTLVKKIIKKSKKGKEKILKDLKKELEGKERKRLLQGAIAERIVYAMKHVTKPGGAASKGDIYGYTEAGKTSTSEKIVNGVYSKTTHISTFIGFAPAKNPRFVLLVAIDEPAYKVIPGIGGNQYGGNCAAPAFAKIGQRSLEYLGIAPDDPFGYPIGDPRRDVSKADFYQEINLLKLKHTMWNK